MEAGADLPNPKRERGRREACRMLAWGSSSLARSCVRPMEEMHRPGSSLTFTSRLLNHGYLSRAHSDTKFSVRNFLMALSSFEGCFPLKAQGRILSLCSEQLNFSYLLHLVCEDAPALTTIESGYLSTWQHIAWHAKASARHANNRCLLSLK